MPQPVPGHAFQFCFLNLRDKDARIEIPLIKVGPGIVRRKHPWPTPTLVHLRDLDFAKDILCLGVQKDILYLPGLGLGQGYQDLFKIHIGPLEAELLAQAKPRQNC
jgi:hypothetical protein